LDSFEPFPKFIFGSLKKRESFCYSLNSQNKLKRQPKTS